MADKKEYIPLTEKQKNNIQSYLESRLGVYGVRSYDFEWEETPNNSFKEFAKQNISLENIGIMKFMIQEIYLRLLVWGDDEHKTISVEFGYAHPKGGRNGHESTIKLSVTSSGNIYEVQN